MSNDQNNRHMLPQHAPISSSPLWPSDTANSTSTQESPIHPNDQWLMEHGFIFNDDFSLSGDVNYTQDSAYYGHVDSSSSQNLDYGLSNALGLDPITASTRVPTMDPGLSTHSAHPSPSQARMHLPQIITSDLRSPSQNVYLSPHHHSSVDYTTGPYSALSMSPSTTGHSTIPITPTSLPPTSGLAPPFISADGLLSPGSPYAWHYNPPVMKSPYSPSLSAPPSPSGHSYSSHSPSDEVVPAISAPRQAHPTVYELATPFPFAHCMLPQRMYRPHTQSDRKRYVEEVDLEAPIMFYTSHPDNVGIPCRDALNCRFARLVGRDDQMFINRGPSVSIRLMWPGYAPWSRQIPTRDFRSPPGPITRAKLAKNVAKTVQRFIEDMKAKPMEEDADPRWRVGRTITIDNLELVGLQHVSMGSWQAHLRVRPRNMS